MTEMILQEPNKYSFYYVTIPVVINKELKVN